MTLIDAMQSAAIALLSICALLGVRNMRQHLHAHVEDEFEELDAPARGYKD